MIARIWRGAVRAEDASAYAAYVQETGIVGYQRTPGNRGAWALWRVEGDRAEFVTMSSWESRSAIEAFAGPDISRADFVWCMTAISWGWSVDETAARLMEESLKAKENGEAYATLTTRNAATAVARSRPRDPAPAPQYR